MRTTEKTVQLPQHARGRTYRQGDAQKEDFFKLV